MRPRAVAIMVFAGLIAGCAGLRPVGTANPPLINPPQSADEAILVARHLARRGRWDAALAAIEAARRQFPAAAGLVDEQASLQQRWAYRRQVLEDRMMLADAEAQHAKVTALEELSRAEPDDLILTSRRLYWKELLSGKTEALTACAEAHVAANPTLSRRCHAQAAHLDSTPEIEERLSAVQNLLRASEQEAVERRRLRQLKERQARARVLLDEARSAIDAHDYRRALDRLAEVEVLQPDNAEVGGLREEAWSMISPQVKALVKLGDHLYLDEQLEAAVATWKAALNLKPDDEELKARIERAKTVLRRLESLRQKQQAVPGVE